MSNATTATLVTANMGWEAAAVLAKVPAGAFAMVHAEGTRFRAIAKPVTGTGAVIAYGDWNDSRSAALLELARNL